MRGHAATFRCNMCRGWSSDSAKVVVRTGRQRLSRSKDRINYPYEYEYVCSCGHVGWSTHPHLTRYHPLWRVTVHESWKTDTLKGPYTIAIAKNDASGSVSLVCRWVSKTASSEKAVRTEAYEWIAKHLRGEAR